jgi:undecaprenyl-diphosphatase
MSDTYLAIILGIVEGLTEYLPVSSTGHLIIASEFLNFKGPRAESFEIFIQAGAILAVLVLYYKYFLRLLDFRDKKNNFSGIHGIGKLFVGAFPIFALGFVFHKSIKTYLFSPFTVAVGLALGAIVILLAEKRIKQPKKLLVEDLTYLDCLKVGIFQCLALWPGVSRSGATIIGGLLLGFERKLAAEFSFILAVPVLLVACTYDLLKSLQREDIFLFGLGFVVSFIVALLSVRVLVAIVQKYSFVPFAYYRLLLAGMVIWYFY